MGSSYRPRQVVLVSDLPKTRNMKVMRRVVRAVYTGQSPGDLSSLVNPETVTGPGTQLSQLLAEQADAAAVGFLHAAKQPQQSGFATATGAFEEQGFTCLQAKRRNIQ